MAHERPQRIESAVFSDDVAVLAAGGRASGRKRRSERRVREAALDDMLGVAMERGDHLLPRDQIPAGLRLHFDRMRRRGLLNE